MTLSVPHVSHVSNVTRNITSPASHIAGLLSRSTVEVCLLLCLLQVLTEMAVTGTGRLDQGEAAQSTVQCA